MRAPDCGQLSVSSADTDRILRIITGTGWIKRSLNPVDHLLSIFIAFARLARNHGFAITKGDEHVARDLPLLVEVLPKGFLDQLTHEGSSWLSDPQPELEVEGMQAAGR